MFSDLTSKERYRKARRENMKAARECRQALISPLRAPVFRDGVCTFDGAPLCAALDKDDPRVKAAVGRWVARARRDHAILMGRIPVIPRLTVIGETGARTGQLFCGRGMVFHSIINNKKG